MVRRIKCGMIGSMTHDYNSHEYPMKPSMGVEQSHSTRRDALLILRSWKEMGA